MPYAQYDGAGNIIGLFANPQTFATTYLQDTDAAVTAFIAAQSNTREISLRQFYEQAAVAGIITQAEAQAAMSGTLPSKVQAFLAQLSPSQQFDATMKLTGAGSIVIDNPLVAPMAAYFGMNAAQTTAFFNAAGNL